MHHSIKDEKVMAIVMSALELPTEERLSYLQMSCKDETLRQQAAHLLQWEERMGSFLKGPLLSLTSFPRPFQPNQLVADRFEIVGEIGEGGMGIVYEALDRKLGELCAIKAAKPGFQRLLSPELKAALKVRHHNICLIKEIHTAPTDVGEVDFLTMELLNGQPLSAYLRAVGKMPPEEVLEVSCQICSGLAEAHERGIVHRDLKSGNIMLCNEADGSRRVVITDFGLAGEPPSADDTAGTPAYMAPELWHGVKASRSSDIYALGVILYEMVVGRRPYDPEPNELAPVRPSEGEAAAGPKSSLASTMATLDRYRKISALPSPPSNGNSDLNSSWDSIVLNCLQVSPTERTQEVSEVLGALRRIRGTDNREAYLLHVKAMHWANKWTPEGIQKAFDHAAGHRSRSGLRGSVWRLSVPFCVDGVSGPSISRRYVSESKGGGRKGSGD